MAEKPITRIIISRPTKIRGKLVEPPKEIDVPGEKQDKQQRAELLLLVNLGKALPATAENVAKVKAAVKSKVDQTKAVKEK